MRITVTIHSGARRTPSITFARSVAEMLLRRGFPDLDLGDYFAPGSHPITLTEISQALRAIGRGEGPRQILLALGYAGWGPGQLDAEIQANSWLSVPADDAIVFDHQINTKWERAIGRLGIDAGMLSSEAGHA